MATDFMSKCLVMKPSCMLAQKPKKIRFLYKTVRKSFLQKIRVRIAPDIKLRDGHYPRGACKAEYISDTSWSLVTSALSVLYVSTSTSIALCPINSSRPRSIALHGDPIVFRKRSVKSSDISADISLQTNIWTESFGGSTPGIFRTANLAIPAGSEAIKLLSVLSRQRETEKPRRQPRPSWLASPIRDQAQPGSSSSRKTSISGGISWLHNGV